MSVEEKVNVVSDIFVVAEASALPCSMPLTVDVFTTLLNLKASAYVIWKKLNCLNINDWVTFYPIKVHLVSVLSTKVAVLGKKMRYLFLSFLLYSNSVDMRQAYRQYCLAGFKISMTQEERENLISGFLSANAGNTDENTTRMLNMLVESLAYSKLQELLPDVQKQSAPSQLQKDKPEKTYLKFTKKELEQMTAKYKHIFAHGDKIVTYRQKKNGVFEARFHRQGIDIEVSSKDLHTLKQKFIDALNNYASTGNVKAKSSHTVFFNDFAKNWLALKERTTKPLTFKEYKRLFEHDIAPAFADKTLADIDREYIQTFLFRYVEQDKLRTAEKLQLILRCIFDLAASDYKFDSPMAKVVLPRHQSKKGSAFTYEEEKQLVDYCIAHPELSASSALLVLLYTGMRRSELKTLRIIDENWLECNTSKEKMGNDVVPRRIPITPMMRKVLTYINFEKAKQTNVNTINTTIKRLFPHHHTHELRYTFITRCKECVQKGNLKIISRQISHFQYQLHEKGAHLRSLFRQLKFR